MFPSGPFSNLRKSEAYIILGFLAIVQCYTSLMLILSKSMQIWDASRCKRVRTMEGHRLRVGALAWSSSQLSSGSRDKSILQRDIRSQEDFVSKLTGHKSEVRLGYSSVSLVQLFIESKFFNVYIFNSAFSFHPICAIASFPRATKPPLPPPPAADNIAVVVLFVKYVIVIFLFFFTQFFSIHFMKFVSQPEKPHLCV